MYQPKVSSEQLEAFGLAVDDFQAGYALWPCVAPAFRLLDTMGTQWRVGVGGAVGLDYAVLPSVMTLLAIGKRQRGWLFDDLRVMEREVLGVINDEGRKA